MGKSKNTNISRSKSSRLDQFRTFRIEIIVGRGFLKVKDLSRFCAFANIRNYIKSV